MCACLLFVDQLQQNEFRAGRHIYFRFLRIQAPTEFEKNIGKVTPWQDVLEIKIFEPRKREAALKIDLLAVQKRKWAVIRSDQDDISPTSFEAGFVIDGNRAPHGKRFLRRQLERDVGLSLTGADFDCCCPALLADAWVVGRGRQT